MTKIAKTLESVLLRLSLTDVLYASHRFLAYRQLKFRRQDYWVGPDVMGENPPASEDHNRDIETPSDVLMIESAELLQGQRQVCIRHNGDVYRLILTRNGRLILQK